MIVPDTQCGEGLHDKVKMFKMEMKSEYEDYCVAFCWSRTV